MRCLDSHFLWSLILSLSLCGDDYSDRSRQRHNGPSGCDSCDSQKKADCCLVVIFDHGRRPLCVSSQWPYVAPTTTATMTQIHK